MAKNVSRSFFAFLPHCRKAQTCNKLLKVASFKSVFPFTVATSGGQTLGLSKAPDNPDSNGFWFFLPIMLVTLLETSQKC